MTPIGDLGTTTTTILQVLKDSAKLPRRENRVLIEFSMLPLIYSFTLTTHFKNATFGCLLGLRLQG